VTRTTRVLEATAAALERAGETVQSTWDVRGADRASVVCVGAVSTSADAQAALVAAVRGAGIVALLPAEPELGAAFFEDLRHIGDVEVAEEARPAVRERLDAQQLELLEQLARGASVAAAARSLFVSRRTAARRLAAARAALGVRSNAEAVLAVRSASSVQE
jgi:DNA-binding NarL/FixJ family response regulator